MSDTYTGEIVMASVQTTMGELRKLVAQFNGLEDGKTVYLAIDSTAPMEEVIRVHEPFRTKDGEAAKAAATGDVEFLD